jgi:hypothetical protein
MSAALTDGCPKMLGDTAIQLRDHSMNLQKVKLSMRPERFTAIVLGAHHVPRRTVIAQTLGLRRFASTSGLSGLAAMMGIAGGGVELRLYLAATRPGSN